MNVYFVISSDERVVEKITDDYPQTKYKLFDNVWAISDELGNAVDVSERLGIGEGYGGHTGVVLRLDNYYGHFNGALWQKVNAWRAASNG